MGKRMCTKLNRGSPRVMTPLKIKQVLVYVTANIAICGRRVESLNCGCSHRGRSNTPEGLCSTSEGSSFRSAEPDPFPVKDKDDIVRREGYYYSPTVDRTSRKTLSEAKREKNIGRRFNPLSLLRKGRGAKSTESIRMQAMSAEWASSDMIGSDSTQNLLHRNNFLPNKISSISTGTQVWPSQFLTPILPSEIASFLRPSEGMYELKAESTPPVIAHNYTKSMMNNPGSSVQAPSNGRSGPITALSRFVETTVSSRLERWSTHTRNLRVLAKARPTALLKGALGSDVRIEFDRIAFHNLKISGGGKMDVNDIAFDLLTLAPVLRRKKKRFAKPFEFHAQDFIFTQDDIVDSSCIQNGLQRLFNRILNKSGFLRSSRVTVQSVDVLSQEKLSCRCIATTVLGTEVPFEVRTGLDVTGQGHILTFPGLEVSLNPTLGVFVPVLPEIHVDIGNNAKIESVSFSGNRRQIKVNAKVTVTPREVAHVTYRKEPSAYLAHFAFDLGLWVTNLGKFNK